METTVAEFGAIDEHRDIEMVPVFQERRHAMLEMDLPDDGLDELDRKILGDMIGEGCRN